MNTTHLVRVTRTLTLRGTVTLEVPINVTADQVRETLVEGNELEGLLVGLSDAGGDGPAGRLGRVRLKQDTEDWRAEYAADHGQEFIPLPEIREALIGDELMETTDSIRAMGIPDEPVATAAVEVETPVAEAVAPTPEPAAKKTAKKRAKK